MLSPGKKKLKRFQKVAYNDAYAVIIDFEFDVDLIFNSKQLARRFLTTSNLQGKIEPVRIWRDRNGI